MSGCEWVGDSIGLPGLCLDVAVPWRGSLLGCVRCRLLPLLEGGGVPAGALATCVFATLSALLDGQFFLALNVLLLPRGGILPHPPANGDWLID